MHIHLKVHHWVIWWFYLGITCGVVALVNIFLRNLTPIQIKLVLVFGVLNWVLGGFVCYCFEGIKIETPQHPKKPIQPGIARREEWHSASDFLLPGARKSLFPPKY